MAAISVVQTAKAVWSSGSSIPVSFSSPTTTGNTIVVHLCGFNATVPTVSSVVFTSGGSGTFSSLINQAGTATYGVSAFWAAPNITGGSSSTITVTFSGTLTAGSIIVHELANMPASLITDGSAAGKAGTAATAISAGPITTIDLNTIVFAGFAPGGFISAGAGGSWVATLNGVAQQGSDEYQIFSSNQKGLTAAATQSSSSVYGALICALRAPSKPYLVQHAANAGSSLSQAFAQNQTAGNVNIAGIILNASWTMTVSDSVNGSYTQVASYGDSAGYWLYIFYKTGIAGGAPPTVTISGISTGPLYDFYVAEAAFPSTTVTVDALSAGQSGSAAPALCTIAPTKAGDLIFTIIQTGGAVPGTQTNCIVLDAPISDTDYYWVSTAAGSINQTDTGPTSWGTLAVAFGSPSTTFPQTPPAQAVAAGFTQLSFYDEFDGPLDIGFGVGGHKWNGGLWYEALPPPSDFTISNSILTITATATTNTNLCTQYYDGSAAHGTSFLGGYFEARIYCTDWSAFWLYRWQQPYGYPTLANDPMSWINEIDIIESDPGASFSNQAFCTLHKNTGGTVVPDEGNHGGTDQFPMPGGGLTQQQWHIYGVLWTQQVVTFYIDNIQVATMAPYPSTWQPTQLILSAQPGGVTGQSSSTVLPPITQVDWVRVWQAPFVNPGSIPGSGQITAILSAAGY